MTSPRILEGRNRANASEAASFVDQYLELEAELDRLKSEHMAKCKKVREQQAELLDDAKAQGVKKKVVKKLASANKHLQKAEEEFASLEDDERADAVDIWTALGKDFPDLPLGRAAVERETGVKQDETTGAIVAAASSAWDDADPKKKGGKAATH